LCSPYMLVSRLTTGTSSQKSDVLKENANQEPIAYYFKWEKL